ncbi:hypothetical protein ABIG05_009077 [Bradyrhizobium japonicum]
MTKTVLLGKLLAELADPVAKLGARAQQMDRQMAAERHLDLCGLERLLDGFLGIGLGALVGLARMLFLLPRRLPPRQRVADKGHDAAEQHEGRHRQPRHQGEHEHHQRRRRHRARVAAELPQHGLLRRPPGAALGDEKARRQRHDQGRHLRDQTVAD